ncbi:hypothetical protein Tco_0736532 [Tanacetum coccineum]
MVQGTIRSHSDLAKYASARVRQYSYALSAYARSSSGDRVMLKVLEKVGFVAYKLELPQEFSRVHNTFHVSNLKKCYSDEPLVFPLEGLHVDDKLRFMEEPLEIRDREWEYTDTLRKPRDQTEKLVGTQMAHGPAGLMEE